MKVILLGENNFGSLGNNLHQVSSDISIKESNCNHPLLLEEYTAIITNSKKNTYVLDLKKKYPRKLLVIIQSNENEYVLKDLLIKSKANIIFNETNSEITAYTQDGSKFNVSNKEQIDLIVKLINEKFYFTNIVTDKVEQLELNELYILDNYPKYEQDGRVYGTFASRRDNGFITTTRGKSGGVGKYCQVFSVNHQTLQINSSQKATLNAPLLDLLLKRNSHINYILHGHELVGKIVHNKYEFAGTIGDNNYSVDLNSGESILLSHHGYIIGFTGLLELKEFLHEK